VGIIDRFTRDEVSAKIWWPLALLFLIALVLTVPGAGRAAGRARDDAAADAAAISVATIEPLTSSGAPSGDVSAATQETVAAGGSLRAVRVWNQDHQLVASSVRNDDLGSEEAQNDDLIDAAIAHGTTQLVTGRTPTGDRGPVTFYAYTKVDGATGPLVTEFEWTDRELLAAVHRTWFWYRVIVVGALLLALGLALLSSREPIARIGAKVPFYPESVPSSLEVMDVERAIALEQAGTRARERVAALQGRLEESERARLRAEAELQQILAAHGSGSGAVPQVVAPPPTRAPAPVSMAPPPPVAEPRQVPPPPKVAPARPKPEPVVVPAATTEDTKRKRTRAPKKARPVAAKAKPAAKTAPQARPEPVPESVVVREEDVEVIAPVSAAARETTRGQGREEWPEIVVLPEPEPTTVRTSAPTTEEEADHASVLEVLHRLVPDTPEPEPQEDPGDMRARLARTAALKKPGSRERREAHEERGTA
jgi:hypothetical protein